MELLSEGETAESRKRNVSHRLGAETFHRNCGTGQREQRRLRRGDSAALQETGRTKMARRHTPRRGVVLLVVLSLLVLFVVVAVTYAVVAGHFRRAAVASSRFEQLGDDPHRFVDRAMYQLLRDTPLPSSMMGHSLLHDLYGPKGVRGVVNSDAVFEVPSGQGQLLRIEFAPDSDQTFNQAFSLYPDYYNGAVLTMLSGPAAGHSTRVLDYAAVDTSGGQVTLGELRVDAFDSDSATTGVAPLEGDLFLINGSAFSGTGFGYDDTTGNLDVTDAAGIAELQNIALYWNGQTCKSS